MSDRFPRTPIHTFGEGFDGAPLDHVPVSRPGRPGDLLFWAALAGLTLLPLGFAAFLLFIAWSVR